MQISDITLAFFEDTGWYLPNYQFAEPLWWGKNRGCDFIAYNKCPLGDKSSTKTGEYSELYPGAMGCDVYGDDRTFTINSDFRNTDDPFRKTGCKVN